MFIQQPFGWHPPRTMAEAHDQALSAALIRIDQLEERVAELEKITLMQTEALGLLKDNIERLLDGNDTPGPFDTGESWD